MTNACHTTKSIFISSSVEVMSPHNKPWYQRNAFPSFSCIMNFVTTGPYLFSFTPESSRAQLLYLIPLPLGNALLPLPLPLLTGIPLPRPPLVVLEAGAGVVNLGAAGRDEGGGFSTNSVSVVMNVVSLSAKVVVLCNDSAAEDWPRVDSSWAFALLKDSAIGASGKSTQ